MVLDYAEGGNLYNWVNKHYNKFDWSYIIEALLNIIEGLKKVHERQMVHRDLHAGNILSMRTSLSKYILMYISDMGLCGKVNNTDEKNIYGVMPYVAPEVLRGRPYTQAADIYSFGMIMYFVATGRQPFSNCAHNEILALDICKGIRPVINDQEVPKCYIDLMKRCLDLNPDNRPKAIEIEELFKLFQESYVPDKYSLTKKKPSNIMILKSNSKKQMSTKKQISYF
jgi:serine/threonine protein kinase